MTIYMYFSPKIANESLGESFKKGILTRRPSDERRSIEEMKADSPLNYMIGVGLGGELFQVTSLAVDKLDDDKLGDFNLVAVSTPERKYSILVNQNRRINKKVADQFLLGHLDVASIIKITKQSMLKNGQQFHQPNLLTLDAKKTSARNPKR